MDGRPEEGEGREICDACRSHLIRDEEVVHPAGRARGAIRHRQIQVREVELQPPPSRLRCLLAARAFLRTPGPDASSAAIRRRRRRCTAARGHGHRVRCRRPEASPRAFGGDPSLKPGGTPGPLDGQARRQRYRTAARRHQRGTAL